MSLFDPELEMAVAAEAVFDHGRFTTYGLRADHFATDEAQWVVEAALATFAARGRVTVELVAQELQRAGRLVKLGGTGELLAKLNAGAVSDPGQLKKLANYRRVRDLGRRLSMAAERRDDTALMAGLEEANGGLEAGDGPEIRTQWELIQLLLSDIQERKAPRSVRTGIGPLEDAIGGGLGLGELSVFMAPPNVGKSTFLLEMGLASSSLGEGVGIIGLEDSEITTAARLWGARAGVSPTLIKGRQFNETQWARMERAANEISTSRDNLLLVDAIGGDELQVCSLMSRMAARGVKLVGVDYLGVIRCSVKYATPRERTDHVLRTLKTHARRCGQHLALVSQISRPQDKSGKPRAPTKHDAKESGNIENECEVMVGLWREQESDFAPVRARVLKGKDGGVGKEWLMQRSRRDGRLRIVTPDEVEL